MTERRREGGSPGSPVLDDVPLGLPALARAARLGSHAGRVGFDFPAAGDVREKVAEELAELDAAVAELAAVVPEPDAEGVERAAAGGERVASVPDAAVAARAAAHVREELGDLLFAAANWARHLGLDPEGALHEANAKFERRFALMERRAGERGLDLATLSLAEWDALWREAKRG